MFSESVTLAPHPRSSPNVMLPRQSGLTRSPERPSVMKECATQPVLGFGLKLKPDATLAPLLDKTAPRKAKTEPPGIAVSDLTDDLLDPIVRLLRLLDRPEDVAVLAPAIEREILWRLINGA